MTEDYEDSLATKYLILKLSKQIDVQKLLKRLRTFQKDHEGPSRWSDLSEILTSAEVDQKQTQLGEYLENSE